MFAREPITQPSDVTAALKKGAAEAYRKTKLNPQLIVVILPSRDKIVYEEVKRAAM